MSTVRRGLLVFTALQSRCTLPCKLSRSYAVGHQSEGRPRLTQAWKGAQLRNSYTHLRIGEPPLPVRSGTVIGSGIGFLAGLAAVFALQGPRSAD